MFPGFRSLRSGCAGTSAHSILETLYPLDTNYFTLSLKSNLIKSNEIYFDLQQNRMLGRIITFYGHAGDKLSLGVNEWGKYTFYCISQLGVINFIKKYQGKDILEKHPQKNNQDFINKLRNCIFLNDKTNLVIYTHFGEKSIAASYGAPIYFEKKVVGVCTTQIKTNNNEKILILAGHSLCGKQNLFASD